MYLQVIIDNPINALVLDEITLAFTIKEITICMALTTHIACHCLIYKQNMSKKFQLEKKRGKLTKIGLEKNCIQVQNFDFALVRNAKMFRLDITQVNWFFKDILQLIKEI